LVAKVSFWVPSNRESLRFLSDVSFPKTKSLAQVTLHNDNDTITCIRALIGQKFIVIVRIAQVSNFKIVIKHNFFANYRVFTIYRIVIVV
jgi:hypothetical protein